MTKANMQRMLDGEKTRPIIIQILQDEATEQQLRVFNEIYLKDKTQKATAEMLNISQVSVGFHLKAINKKIDHIWKYVGMAL